MRKYSVRNRSEFRCKYSFFRYYPWPLLTSFLYQFVERWHSLILRVARVACDEKSNQSKDVRARSIPDLVIPLHQEKLLAILHSQYHSSFALQASNNFQRKRSHWVDFRVGHSHQNLYLNQRHVSDSKSREKADSSWLIRSVVVVARPCWAKAWAAQARAMRAPAHPAMTPAPGSGQSGFRVAQKRNTDRDPDNRSPWPPHL